MDRTTTFTTLMAAGIAAATFDAAALAELPTLTWCSGCTDAHKRDIAAAYPEGTVVFIGDRISGDVQGYTVDRGWLESKPTATAFKPVPPHSDKIRAMGTFYNLPPVGWAKAVTLHYPDTDVNVYSVVNISPAWNSMTRWISAQPEMFTLSVREGIYGASAYFKLADAIQQPSVDVQIVFTDDSRIRLAVDYSLGDPEYTAEPDSAMDSHRNPVMSATSSRPYEFDFSGPGNPTDYEKWLNQMTLLHFGIPPEGVERWACSSAPANRCIHR